MAQMAAALGVPLAELQASFRDYVARNPIDEDVWQGDVEMSWPWC